MPAHISVVVCGLRLVILPESPQLYQPAIVSTVLQTKGGVTAAPRETVAGKVPALQSKNTLGRRSR